MLKSVIVECKVSSPSLMASLALNSQFKCAIAVSLFKNLINAFVVHKQLL